MHPHTSQSVPGVSRVVRGRNQRFLLGERLQDRLPAWHRAVCPREVPLLDLKTAAQAVGATIPDLLGD